MGSFPARVFTAFLESLQMRGGNLVESGSKYVRRGDTTRRAGSFTSTAASADRREGQLCSHSQGSDGRDYDLSVEVLLGIRSAGRSKPKLWWTWRPARTCCGSFLDRTASDLSTCMEQIRAAVGDWLFSKIWCPVRFADAAMKPDCRATPRTLAATARYNYD